MPIEPLDKLNRDLRKAAKDLQKDEVRYLVDNYYLMQENRKRADNQIRAMSEGHEPSEIIKWLSVNAKLLEAGIKGALDAYSNSNPLGQWAREQKGIGPVIAAGLLAHIDLTRCPTVGHIWSFAGLDPRVIWPSTEAAGKWLKDHDGKVEAAVSEACEHFRRREDTIRRYACAGKDGTPRKLTAVNLAKAIARRPWNAQLKTLCWKIGESFVKVSKLEDAFYGHIWKKRKAYEEEKNEAGQYADQAAAGAKRVGKSTEAYKHYSEGRLPPGHIHMRTKRYAVKLFLSHYHQRGREILGLPVPNPYPIEHLGHVHLIEAP